MTPTSNTPKMLVPEQGIALVGQQSDVPGRDQASARAGNLEASVPYSGAGPRSTPKIYYQDDWVTLYHGDCREFDCWVYEPTGEDVLVTDPPYGVDLGAHGAAKDARRHLLVKNGYETYVDSYENYLATVVPVVENFVAYSKRAAVWVGPHYRELPKADAIGGIFNPSASGRNRWGFKTFLPVFLYGVHPGIGAGCSPIAVMSNVVAEKNGHPTPKPLSWMRWLVGLVSSPGETIIDPFAGSGTTLRAAKDMGRRAVGIEIEERYCEIAAQRLAQEVFVEPLVAERQSHAEWLGGVGYPDP